MNYIKEINAFYKKLEQTPLSGSAISLWHALMSVNNQCDWKEEFTVASWVVRAKAGLSEGTFKRARNELKEHGYLIHRPRGSRLSAAYQMVSLQATLDHNVYDKTSTLVKQKKKQKQIVVAEGGPHSFYEQNMGMLTPFIAESITKWCEEMSDELVLESMKIAVKQNKLLFQYCEGILKQWEKRGVKTVEAANMLESKKGSTRRSKQAANQSIFDKLRAEGDKWITEKR